MRYEQPEPPPYRSHLSLILHGRDDRRGGALRERAEVAVGVRRARAPFDRRRPRRARRRARCGMVARERPRSRARLGVLGVVAVHRLELGVSEVREVVHALRIAAVAATVVHEHGCEARLEQRGAARPFGRARGVALAKVTHIRREGVRLVEGGRPRRGRAGRHGQEKRKSHTLEHQQVRLSRERDGRHWPARLLPTFPK